MNPPSRPPHAPWGTRNLGNGPALTGDGAVCRVQAQVEKEPPLPDGWSTTGEKATSGYSRIKVIPECHHPDAL